MDLAITVDPALSLSISALLDAYRRRDLRPVDVIRSIYARLACCTTPSIWIHVLPEADALAQATALDERDPASLPLYGIPFAIKDNIDLAGVPTTAACEAFTYIPKDSAPVVARLVAAGAIPIGKTNLDQFATGLVGTRSPWGACGNSFDPAYISGGSSSGSAVATALGLVSFALGTDTAGSGRIPAAFNNLIGLKPTLGHISTRGMVPACRSLDTVSVFTLSAEDAQRVLDVAGHFDDADPFARRKPTGPPAMPRESFTFAVPHADQLEFFGDGTYAELFDATSARLESLGGHRRVADIRPLLEAAKLLYEGPWVAERYVAIEALLRSSPEALNPVTREIIAGGATPSAAALFKALYRLQTLRRASEAVWAEAEVLLLPTAPTHYRIDEVMADPIRLNSRLGHYTNFVNLLDLAAVAVPAGFTGAGMPFGVTLVGPAWTERCLLALAARLQRSTPATEGATGRMLNTEPAFPWGTEAGLTPIAVCGAHMSGLPLNRQLTTLGATLIQRTRTASSYRLYALPGGPPTRPGLVHAGAGGASIQVEVWGLPTANVGRFMTDIPAPLCIGRVLLEDGSNVAGFLCEQRGLRDARDITEFGGWRAYLAAGA